MAGVRRSASGASATNSARLGGAGARAPREHHHDHAPIGEFIAVDGTRLHYLDRGAGTPVVLLHGNGSMIEDFAASGLIEGAAADHRVVAFDRPGFGYSERPAGRAWTPAEQSSLLRKAFALLDIERPVVVAHSWGTLVAVSLALAGPDSVAGLVLLSGYYYPTPRPDAAAIAQGVAMLGTAVAPLLSPLLAAGAVRRAFAPCAVPEAFNKAYPMSRALWPPQVKAVAEEAAMMPSAAQSLSRSYAELAVPVHLMAGSEDRIVETDKHSARLHRQLPGSTFQRVAGCGHMVHHAAPEDVVAAIRTMGQAPPRPGAAGPPAGEAVRRRWLHIGESAAALRRDLATA